MTYRSINTAFNIWWIMKKKKLGLVLGAGGALGVAHIGFLQAMEENGIFPDVITGCSIGSVVGAIYLTGKTPKQMYKLAKALKKNDLIDFSLNFYRNKAVLKTNKMVALLKHYFGDKNIEDLEKPFACIATDLKSGKPHVFTSGNLLTAVRASSTIPTIFSPVEFEDKLLVDGALLIKTPVKAAKDLGADVTVAVDLLAHIPDFSQANSIIDVALRSIDIMQLNGKKLSSNKPDLMLKPNVCHFSQFRIENQEKLYEIGYNLGIENIEKIKNLLQ